MLHNIIVPLSFEYQSKYEKYVLIMCYSVTMPIWDFVEGLKSDNS